MLTRHCRALNCPRHVAASVLFCDVHFRQLPPRYADPIRRNHDVPVRATITDAQQLLSATRAAIAYLAGKEGRKDQLALANKVAAAAVPPDTVQTDAGAGAGSGAVADAGGSVDSGSTGSGGATRPGSGQGLRDR